MRDHNVEMNTKKNVDGAEAELQGAVIHPAQHWLGGSVERRLLAWGATWQVLSKQFVHLKEVERLVGRLGHRSSPRPRP